MYARQSKRHFGPRLLNVNTAGSSTLRELYETLSNGDGPRGTEYVTGVSWMTSPAIA